MIAACLTVLRDQVHRVTLIGYWRRRGRHLDWSALFIGWRKVLACWRTIPIVVVLRLMLLILKH